MSKARRYTKTWRSCAYVFFALFVFMLALAPQAALALEKLGTPTNLYWDGMTARWDAVPNAAGYSVSVQLVRGDTLCPH